MAEATWRGVLDEYLEAAYQDLLDRQRLESSSRELQVQREYGNPALPIEHEHLLREAGESLANARQRTDVEVIEESPDRVLAQTKASQEEPSFPRTSTRFLLVLDGTWRIEGIFQPCIGCNLPGIDRNAGECMLCRGQGSGLGFEAFGEDDEYESDEEEEADEDDEEPDWKSDSAEFRLGTCPECNGSGQCPRCVDEQTPGWHAVVNLSGLREWPEA